MSGYSLFYIKVYTVQYSVHFTFQYSICSAAIWFCIQNIVLYTELFKNCSVFAQNIINGSVYSRKYLFEYKYAFLLWFSIKRIPIVLVWGLTLHKKLNIIEKM